MTLDSEGTGASAATKLIAVSEIQLDISLFSPESTSSVIVGTVELGFQPSECPGTLYPP